MIVVPAPSVPHRLHDDGAVWRETNCYTDVWIELLHALGYEPLAMLGPCLRVRAEADQWTFFKPSFDDLYALYGLDVNEANPWRGLLQTCRGAVASGRVAIPEVDSWFLPDTAGVAYQLAHVKSSIAVLGLDVEQRTLSYAHNAGCHVLSGDDFDGVFGTGVHTRDDTHLPSYVDMCTPSTDAPRAVTDVAKVALAILRRDVARIPTSNPFIHWSQTFVSEIETVRAQMEWDGTAFHAWAFATFRQFGPAFELSAQHLRWLAEHGPDLTAATTKTLGGAAEAFDVIASTALVFQMRAARAVISGRPIDPTTWMTPLIDAWQCGAAALATLP